MDRIEHMQEDKQGDLPSYEAAPPPYAVASTTSEEETGVADIAPGRAHDAADNLIKPGILVLSGQQIYAASDPTVTLYELNRGIINLSYATSVIEFTRIEQRRSDASADGAPTTRHRPRHIYNLYRSSPLSLASPSHYAAFFIRSVAAPSRQLGHLGLKKARAILSPTNHWTAAPVNLDASFVAGAAALWDVHYKQGTCKWTDMACNEVAIEYDSDRIQHPQLLVMASLEREYLDALVALWCCRIWELTLIGQPLHVVQTRNISSSIGNWKRFQ